MSKNIGLGHVFTDRPSFNKNCGCGLKDDDKGHGNLISLKLFDKGEIDVANLF